MAKEAPEMAITTLAHHIDIKLLKYAFLLTLACFVGVRHGRDSLRAVRATGRAGVVVALSLGLGSACYVFAMLNTTVANVLFILGATPFLTALAAWLLLGERVGRGALVAMGAALAGIGLMFADGLLHGGLLGNFIALGVMASFVVMIITIRRGRAVDMVPAIGAAGLVGMALGALLADTLAVSVRDLLLCLLLGSAQFGAGFILITLGARRLPAAQTALLSLSETVLGPLWVWLAVDETPGALTLAGGLAVLAAVASQALAALRRGDEDDEDDEDDVGEDTR